jgi:hypothetical protein
MPLGTTSGQAAKLIARHCLAKNAKTPTAPKKRRKTKEIENRQKLAILRSSYRYSRGRQDAGINQKTKERRKL